MPLTRKQFIQRANILSGISTEFSFRISKPATPKDVAWRQKQVSRPIPEGLTELATQVGSRIYIDWTLDPKKIASSNSSTDFSYTGSFEFNFFETNLDLLEGWEDCFMNWQDYWPKKPLFTYAELFPVFDPGNGDLVVCLVGNNETGAVYYLSHDPAEDESGWTRIGESYQQFVTILSQLWFPTLDWETSLQHFYDKRQNCVSAHTQAGQELLSLIEECC